MTASDQIAGALALIPSLGDHAVIPGSAAPEPELEAAWVLLERAVTLDPASAIAHALRGNVLVRRGDTLSARRSYGLAAGLDPRDASSRIALGELANMAGDKLESERWFGEAFALTQYFARAPRPGAHTALVLSTMGPWPGNIPLDFVLDPARWTPQRWYLPSAGAAELPAYDVVIDGISASDAAEPALAAAAAFIASQTQPVVNDPARVRATAREQLADTLCNVRGGRATESRRVTRDELLRLAVDEPQLVRPADTHGGRGLERIENATVLAWYAAKYSAEAYDVTPFVDYRNADGFYRKYRIMYVGGEPYPYHLAIDPAWMIHYHSSATALFDWMRDEERLFLRRPERVLPCWNDAVRDVADAVGLDYFGIDCTVLADGTLFVFEADAAMLVHNFDPDPAKIAAHARIAQALDALLARRAG
jgi:tetratricopeptide (TPR) repeat protein